MVNFRLDLHDNLCIDMLQYLSENGWHFNKKLSDYAIDNMTKDNDEKIVRYTVDDCTHILIKNHINIESKNLYDAVYLMNMYKADYAEHGKDNEKDAAIFANKTLNDPDGYDGIALTRYYADTIGKGIRINWESML